MSIHTLEEQVDAAGKTAAEMANAHAKDLADKEEALGDSQELVKKTQEELDNTRIASEQQAQEDQKRVQELETQEFLQLNLIWLI